MILQVSLCACVLLWNVKQSRCDWRAGLLHRSVALAIFTQNDIFRGSEVTGWTDKQFLGRLSHETGKKAVCAYPVISVHVALVGCVHLWDQHPKTGSPRLSNPDVCFCGSAGSAESRSWWARPLVSECLPSLLHWEEPWVALQAQYSSAPPLDQCQATQLNC